MIAAWVFYSRVITAHDLYVVGIFLLGVTTGTLIEMRAVAKHKRISRRLHQLEQFYFKQLGGRADYFSK